MTGAYHSAQIPAGGVVLEADITIPPLARGMVLFAHGSGSSRFSPRNRYVAQQLQQAGLATALADLLTPAEEETDARTGEIRFDIGLLARRLEQLTDWLAEQERTAELSRGYFGASTGAAAALAAATQRPGDVRAVVSRGGRPDLAGRFLPRVHQATLLIVGERDPVVLEMNQQALPKIPAETHLAIVPGASHLFEEPGALEQVANLARDWFAKHLT
jgi:putative phosphoribosyl transferase